MKKLESVLESLRIGFVLGRQDYRKTAAGSVLGRAWPTIGLAIRVLFIGLIFSAVLEADRNEYLAWLATGWLVWLFISGSIRQGASAYLAAKSYIRSTRIPLASYPVREVVREFLILGQNFLFVVLILVLTAQPVNPLFLLFFPGLLLNVVFFVLLSIVVAPLVARYVDLGQLITSLVGVMFFALPIMWRPADIGNETAHLVLGLNPVYHLVQIVRLPLLSESPTLTNYALSAAGVCILSISAFLVHGRVKNKVVYWL